MLQMRERLLPFKKGVGFEEYTPLKLEIGKPYPHTLSAVQSMVRDDDGKNLGIVTTLKDISKETDVENLKMEFLSTVSHELRTPLASVQNVIEIILDIKEAGNDKPTNPSFRTKECKHREIILYD